MANKEARQTKITVTHMETKVEASNLIGDNNNILVGVNKIKAEVKEV